MLKLTINNSTSVIEGLAREQYRSLRKVLSYKVAGSYFSGDPNGGVRYLLGAKGTFATGLLSRVEAWLTTSKLGVQRLDTRIGPTRALGALDAKLDYTPYLVQEHAALACQRHERGIVVAPTGCGKSVMIALTIKNIGHSTLVVVPSLELKRQLTESLQATFGKKLVGGLGKPIAVENVQSLPLNSKVNRTTYPYDCVIIDEYHHSAAKTYRTLNSKCWGHIYYRFGFTATPYRADDEEQALMESLIDKVIYQVPYHTAVERGHIVPLEAYYVEVPKTEVHGHTWAQVYKERVVNNKVRNELIDDLLVRLDGQSVLCLVKEVAHGARFDIYPYAHGENEHTAKLIKTFNKGSSTLVATTGVCGEGVDTKPCEFIILAGLGKSKPALMQAFGRCFRNYPGKISGKIIIFKDNSHKWTKAHFAAQAKVLLEEYNVKLVKLNLD